MTTTPFSLEHAPLTAVDTFQGYLGLLRPYSADDLVNGAFYNRNWTHPDLEPRRYDARIGVLPIDGSWTLPEALGLVMEHGVHPATPAETLAYGAAHQHVRKERAIICINDWWVSPALDMYHLVLSGPNEPLGRVFLQRNRPGATFDGPVGIAVVPRPA